MESILLYSIGFLMVRLAAVAAFGYAIYAVLRPRRALVAARVDGARRVTQGDSQLEA